MATSHNVLTINSISTQLNETGFNYYVIAKVYAALCFYCSVNGNLFKKIEIISEGKSKSEMEALRVAIQNFINGVCYCNPQYYQVHIESYPSHKISHLSVEVGEPFKSMFEQLFDKETWEFEKKELELATN